MGIQLPSILDGFEWGRLWLALSLGLFESLLILVSIRLTATFVWATNLVTQTPRSLRLLTWLIFSIILSGWLATVASFLRINYSLVYLGAGLGLVLVIARGQWRLVRQDVLCLIDALTPAWNTRLKLLAGGIGALFLPYLVGTIHPNNDINSFFRLEYLEGLLHNSMTPYDVAIESSITTPLFGELTFLPSLVLMNSPEFLWWPAMKVLGVIFLALYVLGRTVQLDRAVALTAAAAGVALNHFWIGFTSATTLTNNIVVAGGFLVVGLAGLKIIQGYINRWYGVLLIAGLSMLIDGYEGIVPSLMVIFFLGVRLFQNIRSRPKLVVLWCSITVVTLLLSSGHYYLRNLVMYSNLLYLGHNQTQVIWLLERLFQPEVMQSYFPVAHMSAAGLFFPMTITLGLLLPPIPIAMEILRIRHHQHIYLNLSTENIFFASLVWVGWLVFLFWPHSQSTWITTPPNAFSLTELKYAFGVLLWAEVWLLWLLHRLGIRQNILLVLTGISLLGRLVYLHGSAAFDVTNGLALSQNVVTKMTVLLLLIVILLHVLGRFIRPLTFKSGLMIIFGLIAFTIGGSFIVSYQ